MEEEEEEEEEDEDEEDADECGRGRGHDCSAKHPTLQQNDIKHTSHISISRSWKSHLLHYPVTQLTFRSMASRSRESSALPSVFM